MFLKNKRIIRMNIRNTLLLSEHTFFITYALVAMEQSSAKKPMHVAAEHGDLERIAALMALGAQKDELDQWERTALHYAACNGQTKTITLLITRYGFNPNARDLYSKHLCIVLPSMERLMLLMH